jgi:hypothetical protein
MEERAPDRFCDIVMKGGVTSGVVYPLAIVELADEFRFKSIGGTSAGGIAAAITAAAEYQRVLHDNANGFRLLEALPKFLGGKTNGQSNLLSLFPPSKPARGLFRFAMSFIGDRPWPVKAAGAALRIFGVSWPLTVVFVVLAAALFAYRGFDTVSLLGVILLYAALTVLALAWSLCFIIPRNNFGFSSGMKPAGDTLPGVTEWLHEQLQLAAGRTLQDPPLTFGDLRQADVQLRMITTALTHGRPYTLPFREQTFHFRVSEWERYFPQDVIEHLRSHGEKKDSLFDDLYELPHPDDFPVVVAVRMSLSFPVLFTLVPLYAVDFVDEKNKPYVRSWFIDGGLSSNFPLNLFDSVLPRWPTFGINLASPRASRKGNDPDDPKQWVWMVPSANSGGAKRFMQIGNDGPAAVGDYVKAVLDVIRNWRDNTQMSAPGFADRVVHIFLDKGEGGLNLEMDDAKVTRLTRRGQFAGRLLCRRFGAASAAAATPNWNSHRWTRYKVAMTVLQKALHELDRAFAWPDAGHPTYTALVNRTEDKNPPTGQWWERKRATYQQATHDFLKFAAQIRDVPDFDAEPPANKPELRITART